MKNNNGFLLIELLVSLTLFLIFIFFITKYQEVCLNNSFLASQKNKALNLLLKSLDDNGHKIENQKEEQNFKIIKKEVNCDLYLNNINIYLNNLLGSSFYFDIKSFKVYETIIRFDLFKGKKGEIQIKSE